MTWTHLSVKQNKSTASSACSFYYLFLASRRVYKTAPYCISWSYPLPPFISVWRLSFRRHDAAPLSAKARQSPVLNMQWPRKVLFTSIPISPSPPLSHVLAHLFLPIFPFPSSFHSKLKSNRCSRRKYGPLPKNSLNLLYNWSLGGKLGLRAGWRGGWRAGGMEGSGVQGGRVNVKGWQLHQGSLIENNTAKSQLEQILFKFPPLQPPNPPTPISQCCEVGIMGDCNNRGSTVFFPF